MRSITIEYDSAHYTIAERARHNMTDDDRYSYYACPECHYGSWIEDMEMCIIPHDHHCSQSNGLVYMGTMAHWRGLYTHTQHIAAHH